MKILLMLPANATLRVPPDQPAVPRGKMLRFSLLPLTTVAGLTPPGHEVAICDEHVQTLDFDCDVDLAGVSSRTALAPRAYEIAAGFRRILARNRADVEPERAVIPLGGKRYETVVSRVRTVGRGER